ncbi:hypothetical protein JAO78_014570 [Alishewanella sp. 16-MA]|uniref:Uncharacterized protein n=1 Tax=Alishewanella maricola TaxID=2795740 RepID=A0ABS8C7W1_9ALTE|nr:MULTISPECIES: hypothetical protein [Gammaproteobacteria]MDP4945990.1 hypothetical protein [Alishewanella sp.]MCB5228035.1 hypothetical protein [Alishewanella maricola]MCC5451850.1 hypothetical protein [Rheinheimera sp. UJ51]MCF4009542.1 hypothetical protein [Rheinheimera sp. UJ63]MDP5035873.1 hypothetical protein [Alishewanella sp.]
MSSKHDNSSITPEFTEELRYLHKVMQAIDILGEQPELAVVAYGRIWQYPDLLKTAIRYAWLAQLHGFDIEPFRRWYNRDAEIFTHYGVEWQPH